MSKRYKDRPPNHTTHIVRNKSSRNGVPIKGIPCHSTESKDLPGLDDLNGVQSWFDNSASQASSHIGVDGEGHSALWVPMTSKAWTMGEYTINAETWNIEFVGRAAQPEKDWETAQLKTGAKWAAFVCLMNGFKPQRGDIDKVGSQVHVVEKGILRHKDLTDAGVGTHTDPGWSSALMTQFIDYVKFYYDNGWTLEIST